MTLAVGGGLALCGAGRAAAAVLPQRRLSFYNIHTEETLSTVYWERGRYLDASLSEIDHLLRDFRTGEIKAIDPDLLDLLHRLEGALDCTDPIHVISGYRSPETNAMLRRRSKNVAKNSYHMYGRAIDIRLPGRCLCDLRAAAIAQGRGGVGYYPDPDSQFVHVDTGPVRTW